MAIIIKQILTKNNKKMKKQNKLINQVDDAFNYFNGFRLEELKSNDVYYINALMKYVEVLEKRTLKLNKNDKQ